MSKHILSQWVALKPKDGFRTSEGPGKRGMELPLLTGQNLHLGRELATWSGEGFFSSMA